MADGSVVSAIYRPFHRQAVKTDKDSGIVNDANDYANETVGDPRYPWRPSSQVVAAR